MDPILLVLWALIISASAAGLVQLVRQLAWVNAQMIAGKKPWVCDLCMSWWTSALATAAWSLLEGAPARAFIPAFAMAMILVRALGAPTSNFNPDDLPDLSLEAEESP